VRDSQIQGGEPTVAGTRTTVRSVVLAAREEGTVAGVLTWYPHLTPEEIAAALTYYQHHQVEIDRFIAQNADAAEA
jgi:uncharacterized protein (DUF433 family)